MDRGWQVAGHFRRNQTWKATDDLEIAVETGFHSLVELIAKHEPGKDAALEGAVSSRRLDLVELLLANGADINSVPLADVLLTWEPKLIQFFLDHGADPVAGKPFAEAFGAKIRTALRPFVEYKRTSGVRDPIAGATRLRSTFFLR